MHLPFDRRAIAGFLFVCSLLGLPASSHAQGGVVTPAGGQPPLCTHAAGVNQLRTPANPTAPCGRLTDGYLARVVDGLASTSCATGGGSAVGLVQFDASLNGWVCTSSSGGVSNPLGSDLGMGGFKVTNLGAPTASTDAARNITLSGGAGITDTIGDLSAARSISVNTSEIGTNTFGSGTDFLWTLDGAAASGDPRLGPVGTSIGINSTAGISAGLALYGSALSCLRLDGTTASDINYAQLCANPDAAGQISVYMPTSVPGITTLLTTPLSSNISGSTLYKMTNLVAGTAAGDSVRYEQAIKTSDTCTGDLAGTFPACSVSNDSHSHGDATITAGIDATKISFGDITNTEFDRLFGVSSNIQNQLNGKVSGPASTVDNTVARYDLTSGKIIQTSKCRIDDNGGLDCDPHPNDGGRIVLREGADDGAESVTIAAPNTGLTASPTHTLTATGQLPTTATAYTPTTQTDWPTATWLPTGTLQSTLDYMAAKLKNWFGYYDVVVDITGSATPCKDAQAALTEWHKASPVTTGWPNAALGWPNSGSVTRNIWITGTATSIPQTELKSYGAYSVCLLAAGPAGGALDANGYPEDADWSITFGTIRRLNLDLSGLRITVAQQDMERPSVALKIGLGQQSNWSYEWGNQLNQSLWISGQPDLACSGTATLKESATGTPTTTNVPAASANRGYGWTASELIGKTIQMTSGAANGQVKTITANGTNDITVTSAFSVAPSSGDTFRVSSYWPGSRIPQQPNGGDVFSGDGWPQQSCMGLVEHNYKRSRANNFNPILRSSFSDGGSNGAGNVGWVGINSWIVDRGHYTSLGFAIGGMIYGNMISSLASFTSERNQWGFIVGDPGLDGTTPDGNHVELPRGFTLGTCQIEGSYYSELVVYHGHNLNISACHIEGEDANDRGLTAHVLLGPGTSGAADNYRPCWRDQDLPSGATCAATIPASIAKWNDVNIENTSISSDRNRKAYKLSGWSAGKSSFIAACAAASGTAGADMTAAGRAMTADVQMYDGWWGTDTVQVRGASGRQDQWRVTDIVTCGGQTATIAAYAGHSAGLALGPGTYISNTSNRQVSRIGFNGSMIPAAQMADNEFLTRRHLSTGTTGAGYVPFVAHSTANANIDMSTAATTASGQLYPPKGYPRYFVKLFGGLSRVSSWMPAGSCVGNVFRGGDWSTINTATTNPVTACYAGDQQGAGTLNFSAGVLSPKISRMIPLAANDTAYGDTGANDFFPTYSITWHPSGAAGGNVKWCIEVGCAAVGASMNTSAFTAVCEAFPAPTNQDFIAESTFAPFNSSLSTCQAGEYRLIRIYRDGADTGLDTATTVLANLIGVTENREVYAQ